MTSTSEISSPLQALSDSLAGAVDQAGRSTVSVYARNRVAASGVHWKPGVIVATDHTIERVEGITIGLPDGESVPATLAGRDPGTDLAVLKIDRPNLAVATVAGDDELKIGHIVVAVARPGESGLSASWGAISTLGDSFRTWSGGSIDRLIRADLTLYPGFSGGPLVDSLGRVIGINTSGLSRSMPLAVPAATVNRVIDQLLAKGRISRGYLGLGLQPARISEQTKTSLGLAADTGLIVISVQEGGPAEKAGVLLGDVVVTLDGKPVTNNHDVQSVLDPERVGTTLNLRLLRAGTPTDVSLVVGERPVRGE